MKYDIDHVLMTADAVGGVWTYCLDLARELSRHGVRTSLAVMGPAPSARQVEEAEAVEGLRLYAGDYKLEWMEDAWSDVDAASGWLLALADRIQPDVIHLNGYCHASLAWPAPTLVVCHSDVFSWYAGVKKSAPGAEWLEYRKRVGEGLRQAGMVIAPTAAVLAEVQEHFGENAHGRVIYNGRPDPSGPAVRRVSDESDTQQITPSGPRVPGDPFVLAAGRIWDEAKNIAALAQVSTQWPIYVAGEGEAAGNLQHLGKLPPDEMHRWMADASIYALPVKYEPFGLSILEAALNGCALVLGDIPTMRELWEGAAVFVDPFDPRAIEIGINYLIKNDGVREQLATAARNRAQLYSAKAMGCGYLFAYQDLKQGSELLQVASLSGVSLL